MVHGKNFVAVVVLLLLLGIAGASFYLWPGLFNYTDYVVLGGYPAWALAAVPFVFAVACAVVFYLSRVRSPSWRRLGEIEQYISRIKPLITKLKVEGKLGSRYEAKLIRMEKEKEHAKKMLERKDPAAEREIRGIAERLAELKKDVDSKLFVESGARVDVESRVGEYMSRDWHRLKEIEGELEKLPPLIARLKQQKKWNEALEERVLEIVADKDEAKSLLDENNPNAGEVLSSVADAIERFRNDIRNR